MKLDILMITHDRLAYLQKALSAVLAQEDVEFRLKIWDNNSGHDVVDFLSCIDDQRVTVHYNKSNDSLASVTTKVFLESDAEFVGKVDSDTLVPFDWAKRLVWAHEQYPCFGFIGGFHFRKEDLKMYHPKIDVYNGVSVWRKHHIGGCAFVIRRKDFKGYKGDGVMGLSEYQYEMGLPNGYLWDPILWVDHMEDKRSEHYIGTDEYNDYKIRTRGVDLSRYQSGIVNETYMAENTL
jgi:glycosyltransferase involved in cell wall biosynthesis